MQHPEPHDAPIVPYAPDTSTQPVYAEGGTRREPDDLSTGRRRRTT